MTYQEWLGFMQQYLQSVEKYSSIYSGQQIDTAVGKALNPDTTPTASSSALITSSAVKSAIDNVACRPNLLDNWYFVGGGSQQGGGQFPINQRGLTSYSGARYGIDRWYSGDASASVTVNQGSVTFTVSAQYNGILQYVEEPMLMDGQKHTLSVLTTSGCYSWTFVASKTTPVQSSIGWYGVANLYSYVDFYSNSKWRIFLFDNATSSVKTVDVIAVKLELGDTQTLAHQENGVWVLNEIPNFQQELAKCQRYQRIFDYTRALAASQGASNCFIEEHCPMAKTPAVTFLSSGHIIDSAGSTWNAITGADVTVFNYTGDVLIQFNLTNSAAVGACYLFNTKILLDANL